MRVGCTESLTAGEGVSLATGVGLSLTDGVGELVADGCALASGDAVAVASVLGDAEGLGVVSANAIEACDTTERVRSRVAKVRFHCRRM